MHYPVHCFFFFLFFTIVSSVHTQPLQLNSKQVAALKALSEYPFIKLLNKPATDPAVKKITAERKMKLPGSGCSYYNYGSIVDQAAVCHDGKIIRTYINTHLYAKEQLKAVGYKSPVPLPMNLKWNTTEATLLGIFGSPVWVTTVGYVGERLYEYHFPLPGIDDKLVIASFLFAFRHSPGIDRCLQSIEFYISDKKNTGTSSHNKVPGEKFAALILQKNSQPVASLFMIPDTTLNRLDERILKTGYTLLKDFHPNVKKANSVPYPSEGFEVQMGKKYFIYILTKDSLPDHAVANNYSFHVYDKYNRPVWSNSSYFSKIVYDRETKVFRTGIALDVPLVANAVKCEVKFTYYDKQMLDRPIYARVYTKPSEKVVSINNQPQQKQPVVTTPSPNINNQPVTALQFAQQYKDSYTQQQGYYYTKLSPATTNNMGYQTFSGCEQPGYELTVNFFVEQKYNLSIEVSKSCVGQPTRTVSSPTFSLVSVINGIKIYTDKFGRWSEQGACSQCNYYFRVKTNSPTMTEVPMVTTTTKLQK